ncbi:MAG: hypothetical protein ABGY95_01025, partial [Rubritalea sp.]
MISVGSCSNMPKIMCPSALCEAVEVMGGGQVISIERGLYIPSISGYRIEDSIVLTRAGYEFIKTLNYDSIIE